MIDQVGFGVAIASSIQFVENFPERAYKSDLITIMRVDKREGNLYSLCAFAKIKEKTCFIKCFVIYGTHFR